MLRYTRDLRFEGCYWFQKSRCRFSIDENYLLNLEVPFVAGKNFEPDSYQQVILNEKALEQFKFEGAADAIGQLIYMGDSTELRIVGVVRNFNFRPLSYEIGPLALRYNPDNISILSAKISGDAAPLLAQMEVMWKKVDSRPFEYQMMEAEIDNAYQDAGFFDIISIVGYITLLAIVLACLGMLGMAMHSTQVRLKEIGVRKVMGASTQQITFTLSRSFLILIGIAMLIGMPLGYLICDTFLSMYAYQVGVSVFVILASVATICLLGFIAIGSQTWRAASTDPVKTLRYE